MIIHRIHHLARQLTFVLAGALCFLSVPARAFSVETMTPTSGSTSGGTPVVINGKGFIREESEKFVDVAAGVEHALLLSQSGHIWAVGSNTYGQLGSRKVIGYTVQPVDVTAKLNLEASDRVETVAAGDYSSYAISQKHRVFAWGHNDRGQLGQGGESRQDRNQPVEITDKFTLRQGDFIRFITAGANTAYALTDQGYIYVWGEVQDYIDGDTNRKYADKTAPVEAAWLGDNIKMLAAGNRSAISLDNVGNLQTWGRNDHGELGRSRRGEPNKLDPAMSAYYISSPGTGSIPSLGDDTVIQVAAGDGVMAILTKNDRLFIWGNHQTGMLGIGDDKANPADHSSGDKISSVPIELTKRFKELLEKDDRISRISVGNSQVLALSQYGRVFSWGSNDYGQLGDGSNIRRNRISEITDRFTLPTKPNRPDGTEDKVTVQQVLAAGAGGSQIASYSYALDSEGNVYAWGGSAKGLPGINVLANTNQPKLISNRLIAKVSNITAIRFGDKEVADYEVGDDLIKLLTPASDHSGAVEVTLSEDEDHETKLSQLFTYTDPVNPDDDKDKDKGGDNDQTGDKNDNKDKDKVGDQKNDNTTRKPATRRSASGTGSTGSKYRLAAPNTGAVNELRHMGVCRVSRRPCID